MAQNGVDLIEIGIPFSDPTAEGAVIANANEIALKNGINTDKIFESLARVRKQCSVNLSFMTYANVVFSYGKERFIAQMRELEMNALILPDVPFKEKSEFDGECRDLRGSCEKIRWENPYFWRVHQAIAIAFGAQVGYAKSIMHGKTSQIALDIDSRLFKGFMPKISRAITRLPCLKSSLPKELKNIAKSEDGEIMAIEHTKYALFGKQFHPESVMTIEGKKMIANILSAI